MNFIREWYYGLKYPFKEKDWVRKMWLIPLIGVVLTPFIELLILRGWRVELVRRIGLKYDDILPEAGIGEVVKYAIQGIKLYLITAIYLFIPFVLFKIIGVNPFRQLFTEIFNLFGYLWHNDSGLSLVQLLWRSFWKIAGEIFISNMWLVFYYPYYRTATIRYSITGKFRKSHLAFMQNIKFILGNVTSFIRLVINQIVDLIFLFVINAIINIVLTPIGGYFLAPLFFFYASFWASGYDYGEIAVKMVEQEYPEWKLSVGTF